MYDSTVCYSIHKDFMCYCTSQRASECRLPWFLARNVVPPAKSASLSQDARDLQTLVPSSLNWHPNFYQYFALWAELAKDTRLCWWRGVEAGGWVGGWGSCWGSGGGGSGRFGNISGENRSENSDIGSMNDEKWKWEQQQLETRVATNSHMLSDSLKAKRENWTPERRSSEMQKCHHLENSALLGSRHQAREKP